MNSYLEETDSPYEVEQHGGQYKVVYHHERSICVVGDATNAAHYATLLNEAHRRAYKLGYRAGKAAR